MPAPDPEAVPWDADPAFAATWVPRMLASPCFRPPTPDEVQRSYAAYVQGDSQHLCEVWREHAQAVRAELPFPSSWTFPRLGWAPGSFNRASFLVMASAALTAGQRFRSALRPEVQATVETDFPWLEQRHVHLPAVPAPRIDFPDVMRAFIDAPTVEEAQVRWQLCTMINEVQQSAYSHHTAVMHHVPELARHAARESELAVHYMAAWSPPCTEALWEQTLWVLDAINAALFAWASGSHTPELVARSLWQAASRGRDWQAFVRAMDTPQWLWPLDGRPTVRRHLDEQPL